MNAWSLRSLARRMLYFRIQFTDHDVEVNEVEDAVKKEISGPGKLLGYRKEPTHSPSSSLTIRLSGTG